MSAQFPEVLQAARLRLVRERPYLSTAAWAMRPVARPGLGTLAVDQWWRVYFDPDIGQRWTVEELAGVLYHEILHLLRDHASRGQYYDRTAWNLAVDAEINDDLQAEGILLPKGAVTPGALGQPEGLLAEEYVQALMHQKPAQAKDGPGASGDVGTGDAAQGGGENGSEDSGMESGAATSHGSAGDSAGDQQGGDAASGSSDDGAQGSGGASSSGRRAASSPEPVDSTQQASGGSAQAHKNETPKPAAGRCGSAATGQPEPWENAPPTNGEDGISRAESELIRRSVAQEIRAASKSRGDVPGHLRRWAEERLEVKINPHRLLASAVRGAIANVAGAIDYSRSRPSRRFSHATTAILPSLRRPIPNVALVADTSGSVDDRMVSQELGVISAVLRATGPIGLYVLSVDAHVHTCRRIMQTSQVQLIGGGGTDMGVGLRAAEKLRPDVVIVVTDGYTPWPVEKPRKLKHVIVAMLGDKEGPEWARTIKID